MILDALFTPASFIDPNGQAVYSHTLPHGPGPAWIGTCRAADLLLAPDALLVPAWRQTVQPVHGVRLTVLSLHPTAHEAQRATLAAVRLHRPPVNLQAGPIGSGVGRAVLCVETGVLYDTAAECAKAHGFFESQLSVYLNKRKPGTLRGYTFKRV